MRLKVLVVPIIFILLFTSCKTVDVIRSIYSEEAELMQFSNNDKNIYFIPMHHIGKQEFYNHVAEMIKGLKQQGYVVYYESARMDRLQDSLTLDLYNRKFRKMMGAHIDSTGYAILLHEKGLFKNLVDQPSYEKLGLDEKDRRVDLSKNHLVDAYESKFGTVELSEADKKIPLGHDYPIYLRLSQKQLMDIIIDYRNRHLAKNIQDSKDKKVLVIYGALHVDGTFDELKKMDRNWKRKR